MEKNHWGLVSEQAFQAQMISTDFFIFLFFSPSSHLLFGLKWLGTMAGLVGGGGVIFLLGLDFNLLYSCAAPT